MSCWRASIRRPKSSANVYIRQRRRRPSKHSLHASVTLMSLKGKTLFITGASRGIGLAIALRAARDGANIAIAAKTETAHPKLEGTIHSAAEVIEQAGGQALPLVVDVRDEAAVKGRDRPDRGALRL